MRSIHLCSFKVIPEILFELCPGQKCGLRTDRLTDQPTNKCKAIYHSFFEGGHKNKQRTLTQNLSKQELRFLCTALPHDEIYPPTKFRSIHPQNFITIASIVLVICSGQNSSMKKKRAITQKLRKQELQFLCTALHLDEIYPSTKFHNHSWYSFGDMLRTKFKYENKQRAITQKLSH